MTDTIDPLALAHGVADIIDTLRDWRRQVEVPELVDTLIDDVARLMPDRPQPHKFRIGQWVIVSSITTYHGLTGWIMRESPDGRLIVALPGVGGDEHSGPQAAHVGYAPEDLKPNTQIPDVRIETVDTQESTT